MGRKCPKLFVCLFVILIGCVLAQVDIQENYDGYHRMVEDPETGTKEIYTSMHQLREFFETEKEFVNDVRQMIEKKLVSQKAVGALGKKKKLFLFSLNI
jgi:hypothetical protein